VRIRKASALAAALATAALAACQRQAAPPPAAPTTTPPPAAAAAASAGEARPFEVALLPPEGARAGQAATARVVVKATGTFHVNRDYPMAFRPEPGSAGAFGADRIPLGDGAERTPCAAHPEEACAVSAPLRFTLREPGQASLAGTVAFSVCNADLCLIEKAPLSMAVTAAR
jgi:hypothetical protein